MRDKIDINDAFKIAQDVTKAASLQGIKAQPVATRIGKDILIGFVERATMPKILGR